MNGYLVVLRHTIDDLPIGLFATWDQAHAYAMAVNGMPGDWDRDVFQTDCSTPCAVAIATFKDSFVKAFDIVRVFDDDEDDDEDEPAPEPSPQPVATA